MLSILRKLLWPIVPIYYGVTWLRNLLYDKGVKSSTSYDFPVIAVGNLSVGGTGKSPMVEYLIRLLQEHYSIATLSRGYKRETKGFQLVTVTDTAKMVGDEPLQFKLKYPDIHVAVDANRTEGIAALKKIQPKPQVILLDDAYQHRKVTAGMYILLTSYYDLYCDDVVLPAGNLREPRRGMKRAHTIVVTKCPAQLSVSEQERIKKRLSIAPTQALFFSTITYDEFLRNEEGERAVATLAKEPFTLVTGIANPKPLVQYYKDKGFTFTHLNYPDHHHFTPKEVADLQQRGILITTEKDYVRLSKVVPTTSLWYQPITTTFLAQEEQFDHNILTFVESFVL